MIELAKPEEKEIIHRMWKQAFHHDDGGSIDSYFRHYYDPQESYVYRKDGEIVVSGQIRSKILSLHDKNIRVSYIVGLLTAPKYQGQGHMKRFMKEVLNQVSQKDLITVLMAYEPKVYDSLGFETVIETYEYNINTQWIYDFGVEGITLSPNSSDLLEVYKKFTKYFTGYFVRTENDFELMKKDIKAQGGGIIGLLENQKLVGYCVYTQHASYVEVQECCYDKSGTLLRLLSFVTKGKSRLVLRATTAEKIRKLFPNARRTKQPFMLARINDQELFERLYHLRILSAYSAFHAFGKPLFNRDYQ